MASLDLSDAFDSSMLSRVDVIHRTAVLDEEGVFQYVEEEPEKIYAVVTPISSDPTNARENQYILDAIQVYSRTVLKHHTLDAASDLLVYEGKRYKVDSVLDYGIYGRGFWNATARIDISEVEHEPEPEPEPNQPDQEMEHNDPENGDSSNGVT